MISRDALHDVILECEVLAMYYKQIRQVSDSHIEALDKIDELEGRIVDYEGARTASLEAKP